MAGEVAVEVSSLNGKIKEQCAVDASQCHDLTNGGPADCNGMKSEDADRTYVFVNGSDAVVESGDNDEKCTEAALVEESAENLRELQINGEIETREAKLNGANGHCDFEKVAAIGNEVVEVESGKAPTDPDRGHEMKQNSLVTGDLKGVSDKLGPVEEVDAVISAESKALWVVSSENIVEELDSSFEVVEKGSESEEYANDSSYCKESPEVAEELPERVVSTSAIVKDDPESQAVNAEDTNGLSACREPEQSTTELPEKVQCNSEVFEVVPESNGDADGLDGTEESSEIVEKLPQQMESISDVVEGVLNPQLVSQATQADAVNCDTSFDHGVDLPMQEGCAAKVVEEIPQSHEIVQSDVQVTGDCEVPSENSLEKTAKVSELMGEDQQTEFIVTYATAPELTSGGKLDELVAEETKPYPLKDEKVAEPSPLSPISDAQAIQECAKVQASDANNDVEQEKELTEVAAEFSPLDQLNNNNGDHDQVPEPSAHYQSSDLDASNGPSSIENEQYLEAAPVSDPASTEQVEDDSVDASLETEKLAYAPGNADVSASSADCSNVPVESAESPQAAEEAVEMLDALVAEKSLTVADEISCPALHDREPAPELLLVNDDKEPVLEGEIGNGVTVASADSEVVNGAQDRPVVTDVISFAPGLDNTEPAAELVVVNNDKKPALEVEVDNAEATVSLDADVESGVQDGSVIGANHCSTKSPETQICFGSISQKELSSISSESRNSEAKYADDPACSQPSLNSETLEKDEALAAEVSAAELTDALPSVPEVVKRFFNYRVRLPRYDGEDLKEKINEALAQVDEKTRIRDAIQAEIQMIKATRKSYSVELDTASAEERSARDLLKSKRQEIDTVQSVLNKVRDALSIDDIDARIHGMEHRIEHETLPLKEEKQLLREIKQWKQHREQLSSNMGKQDELKEAMENKEQTEERLKALRKEVELLRDNVSRAEVVTKAAKKKHSDGNNELQKLHDQFKAADAVRQEAYLQLQSLRKQLYDKNKYFFKYRDDARISSELGSKGDRDGVFEFCIKQVEEFMELWNNKEEFRNDYIRCRFRGTLKRLGTKDGRSVGTDEQPPVIPPLPSERVVKDKPTPAFPSLEQSKARAAPVVPVASAGNVQANPVEQKKPKSKAKVPVDPSEAVVLVSPLSVTVDEVLEVKEEPKLSKEEEEKARKEEEMRKEKEAAKFKEQRRLEEKAKAEAALERKKRNAERALARAAAKAQKEAEQKEKEKQKRLMKKERKKTLGSAAEDVANEGEAIVPSSQSPSETTRESETREKVETVVKRPQKPSHFTKQIKAKPAIPAPLRNRSKRKIQPWMWAAIAAALVLALVWWQLAGNFSKLLSR